jgi:hypothetical protein
LSRTERDPELIREAASGSREVQSVRELMRSVPVTTRVGNPDEVLDEVDIQARRQCMRDPVSEAALAHG